MTAMSTACSAKCLKPTAVTISKKVGSTPAFSAAFAATFTPSANAAFSIGCPLMTMRSRSSTRCGLV